MPAGQEPRGGLFFGWETGENGWGDALNDNLSKISRLLVNLYVIDMISMPPASPADGDAYIVNGPGSGAWSGQENNLAIWDGSDWVFYPPSSGWICLSLESGSLSVFTGSGWINLLGDSAYRNTLEISSFALGGVVTAGWMGLGTPLDMSEASAMNRLGTQFIRVPAQVSPRWLPVSGVACTVLLLSDRRASSTGYATTALFFPEDNSGRIFLRTRYNPPGQDWSDATEILSTKIIPTPPSTGTYTLQSVDGVISWVSA